MLVHIKEIVGKAQAGGYALPAFNIHNLETALGVAAAAQTKKAPIIMQVSGGAVKYMGVHTAYQLIKTLAENQAGSSPVAMHLDHGKTAELVEMALQAGWQSVHRDASDLPLDENIAETKKTVALAHPQGVWVQGEVGAIVGGHGDSGVLHEKIPLADPPEVARFVKETGVDTVAAAIGTAHGNFVNEKINFGLIKEIKKIVGDIPLVMHGGSGASDKDFKKAITLGVNIINIGTHIKQKFSQAVIAQATTDKGITDPRLLLTPGITAVQKIAEHIIEVFGCANRA